MPPSPNQFPSSLFLPLVIHIPSLLKVHARDFMFRVSYDILKMKVGLLDLKRKLQRHGKRIVKITVPPTGVVAVTRSTGSVIPFGLLLALTTFQTNCIFDRTATTSRGSVIGTSSKRPTAARCSTAASSSPASLPAMGEWQCSKQQQRIWIY